MMNIIFISSDFVRLSSGKPPYDTQHIDAQLLSRYYLTLIYARTARLRLPPPISCQPLSLMDFYDACYRFQHYSSFDEPSLFRFSRASSTESFTERLSGQ